MVLARVKSLATSGDIWRTRHFQLYLYRWRHWVGQEDVNAWLVKVLDTPERKLDFLARMFGVTIVNGQRGEHYLNAKSIENFATPSPWRVTSQQFPLKACQHLRARFSTGPSKSKPMAAAIQK